MNHKDRLHARIGASDAERWLNCTPSIVAEEQLLRDKPKLRQLSDDSTYSVEGTIAHEVLEAKLQFRLRLKNPKNDKRAVETDFIALRKELMSRYSDVYDAEMERATNDAAQLMFEELSALEVWPSKGPVCEIEKRVEFDNWVEDGFGTVDFLAIGKNTILVIDFKYGKGIMKYAPRNPQMRLYALGALQTLKPIGIKYVKTIIIQPRLDHFSTEIIDKADLLQWASEIVEPKAAQASIGKGPLSPGPWCQWCKVSAHCRALADHHLELARDEFSDEFTKVDLMTDKEILEIYSKLDDFNKWVKSIKDHVFETALAGQKWPGYKLVEGRTRRTVTDQDAAIKTLMDKGGFFDYEVSRLTLKPFGELEKLMSKDTFESLLNPFIEQSDPKPSIAPESDKRPEYGLASAIRDFTD